jgi:2-dehydro-3-deoxyphosphogalactonate aldolase
LSLNRLKRFDMLKQAMAQNGLIAILRGLRPEESVAIGQVLYDAGFRIIEVPLNSPQPYDSIRLLRNSLPADCLIGAGTVLSAEQVQQVKAAGGQLIVMPHSDPAVLKAAKEAEMYLAPGVVTPTEAFAALAAGADVLKLFPAEALTPAVVKALLAVLPKGTALVPVGGIPGQHAAVPECRGGGFRIGLGPVQARHDGAAGGRECQGVQPGLAVADGRTALNRTYCGHR